MNSTRRLIGPVRAAFLWAGFAAMSSGPAMTQTAPNQSAPNPPDANAKSEAPVTKPEQVDPGQLMTLPAVGNAGRSAAPTMVFDCAKQPTDCVDSVKPSDGLTPPIDGKP